MATDKQNQKAQQLAKKTNEAVKALEDTARLYALKRCEKMALLNAAKEYVKVERELVEYCAQIA